MTRPRRGGAVPGRPRRVLRGWALSPDQLLRRPPPLPRGRAGTAPRRPPAAQRRDFAPPVRRAPPRRAGRHPSPVGVTAEGVMAVPIRVLSPRRRRLEARSIVEDRFRLHSPMGCVRLPMNRAGQQDEDYVLLPSLWISSGYHCSRREPVPSIRTESAGSLGPTRRARRSRVVPVYAAMMQRLRSAVCAAHRGTPGKPRRSMVSQ